MKSLDMQIRMIETPQEMAAVEDLQRLIWGDSDVVPRSLLYTAVLSGGILLGAYTPEGSLIGFTFSFLGHYYDASAQVERIKHCSHMLATHPDYQGKGVGVALKRAQWQMVRQAGYELITWTFDPLLSRNAYLNIDRLGGIVKIYYKNHYGEMDDFENAGLPSDRFLVELWVNSSRVKKHLSRNPRRSLDLGHYFSAGAEILNPTKYRDELITPPENPWLISSLVRDIGAPPPPAPANAPPLYLVEIPANFKSIKQNHPELALTWRMHTRALFQDLFTRGYMVTDFVYLRAEESRSFYVLSNGEAMLGGGE